MNSRSQGQLGEMEAARYLRSIGYDIAASNYRCRFGELDIVARDGQTIVFVEVKTRSPGAATLPREAVTRAKQRKLCRAALYYLGQNIAAASIRFDVIEVILDSSFPAPARINHIKHAFEAGEDDAFF